METLLWLGWVGLMYGFVYGFPMCWPWVGSTVVWMDGLILCLVFVGSELRLDNILRFFAIGNVVVAGVGCGHVVLCTSSLCVGIGFGVLDVFMHVHFFLAYMHLWGSDTPWAEVW